MLQLKVFVVKLVAIDAHAACAVPLDEIPTLEHEPLDYAVKAAPFEANGLAKLAAHCGQHVHSCELYFHKSATCGVQGRKRAQENMVDRA